MTSVARRTKLVDERLRYVAHRMKLVAQRVTSVSKKVTSFLRVRCTSFIEQDWNAARTMCCHAHSNVIHLLMLSRYLSWTSQKAWDVTHPAMSTSKRSSRIRQCMPWYGLIHAMWCNNLKRPASQKNLKFCGKANLSA